MFGKLNMGSVTNSEVSSGLNWRRVRPKNREKEIIAKVNLEFIEREDLIPDETLKLPIDQISSIERVAISKRREITALRDLCPNKKTPAPF